MPALKAGMLFRVLFSLASSNEIIDGDPFPRGESPAGSPEHPAVVPSPAQPAGQDLRPVS